METTTTTLVTVLATTQRSWRSRSQRDGLLGPSVVTPLAGVTSTMLLIPCYVGPSTGTLGLLSIVV
jgi:hypothetical protein